MSPILNDMATYTFFGKFELYQMKINAVFVLWTIKIVRVERHYVECHVEKYVYTHNDKNAVIAWTMIQNIYLLFYTLMLLPVGFQRLNVTEMRNVVASFLQNCNNMYTMCVFWSSSCIFLVSFVYVIISIFSSPHECFLISLLQNLGSKFHKD